MHYHSVAIAFEWVGTFFLAVEAIKLENLAIFRVRLRRMSFFSDRLLGPGLVIPFVALALVGAVVVHFALALFHISSIELVERVAMVHFARPLGIIFAVLLLAPLLIVLSYIG